MPQLKEYIFENLLNSNITIKIMSYSFINAYEILVMELKHPADYKCINL